MKYNFETIGKRYHSGSKKWNELLDNGVREDEDIIPFSVADMEIETAPEIVSALKDELDHFVLGYANPTEEYLNTVCRWMKERHGWDAKPEWILPAAGVIDAFFEAVKVFTKEGEGVMLMTPVYYPMYHAVNFNHRKLVDCPLVNKGDHYEIDFEDFERKAADENTKMLILCSPHNPCGRVWTREELTRIGKICLKNHVLVVSDEIHFDLVMPGYKHIVFPSLSDEIANNCVLCTAPSKTFNLAGLQTSNIFIPNPELRAQYFEALKRTNPNPKCNILGYRACEAAYKHCAPWLEQAIQVIDTNRKLVEDFLAKEFPPDQGYPAGGYLSPVDGLAWSWASQQGAGAHQPSGGKAVLRRGLRLRCPGRRLRALEPGLPHPVCPGGFGADEERLQKICEVRRSYYERNRHE